jgi:glycosyltransferase involved in cell wall biosynthesis
MTAFSIVTPSFNMATALRRAIGSVRGQNDVPHEHIIQDGGSTDGTAEWLATQSGITWRSESDSGMYDAINRGWERASGGILSWLNCDEQYLPGTLQAVRAWFDRHSDADVVVGDMIVIDENGNPIAARREIPLRGWYVKNTFLYAPSCAIFFRRRLLDQGLLRLDTRYRYSADKDLVLRLLDRGVRFGRLPEYLSLFTMGRENLSTHQAARVESHEVARAHGGSDAKIIRGAARACRWTERLLRGNYRPAELSYRYAQDEKPSYRDIHKKHVGFRMKWTYQA